MLSFLVVPPTTSRLLPNNLKISHSSMTSNPDVPPFTGYVETTLNALRLIHAARQGVIPRITRRLNDSERRTMIRSGAVFVFSVEESGIKRWTDGLLWSPSRIVGNFLVYREINERTSSRGSHKKPYPLDPPSRNHATRKASPDQGVVAFKPPGHFSQGHGSNDQGTFKLNGLIKKTITVTIDGSDLHLISYYTSEDIRSGRLKRPTHRPDIMSLSMPPHIFRLTNFRVPPKIDIGPDGKPRLVCEAEDLEPVVQCKVEEPTYQVESPQWASDSDDNQHSPRIDIAFGTGSMYSENTHHNLHSPVLYSRETTGDKWPLPLENLRIVPINRQDLNGSWSPSPSPTQTHSLSRRRDSGHVPQTNSWSGVHSHSSRWRSDSYVSPTESQIHLDRSRARSNTVFESTHASQSHRRESDTTAHFNREGAPQRLPWAPREPLGGDKYIRSPQSSFSSTSPTLPFSQNHGYHRATQSFGTEWPPNSHGSPVEASLQSSPSVMQSYDAPYISNSEHFSNVEDYADS
ncbi:Global transcription regulator FGP1 [Hypsizygus marmoreus]|uniref:Global transcription regulator FGP1 n=1 Tax=Hypsizygus marmoreus TaxID=39966 RepID=A0A369JU13_HYPMA|nr:Global transcription regulator FGP1 [Hypsizygus marmoreus]